MTLEKPAAESLQNAIGDFAEKHPELKAAMDTVGMSIAEYDEAVRRARGLAAYSTNTTNAEPSDGAGRESAARKSL